ncbi:MAG: flap structure-specific endonuclease, partial [Candidatus Altiarchaeota archaeon]|nr:flap structure-specific endonuclease [Candidatus Altiarchaeota archaeon]
GTDFNKEGIKGIGPKKAIKIVKEGKFDEFKDQLGVDADVLRGLFLKPEVTDRFDLKWKNPNSESIKKILVDGHGFSEERVDKGFNRLGTAFETTVTQSSLSQWF